MTQISILGCGWLGFPLAKRFIEEGYSVNGSTTSESKLSVLENAGINPFLVVLESESISESYIKSPHRKERCCNESKINKAKRKNVSSFSFFGANLPLTSKSLFSMMENMASTCSCVYS